MKDLAAPNARFEAKDWHGRTPIALAAASARLEVVKDLAARNANLEAKDNYGMTPIACAAAEGQLEVVKNLTARNADLEAKDNSGMTPIAWAAFKGRVEVVEDFCCSQRQPGGQGRQVWHDSHRSGSCGRPVGGREGFDCSQRQLKTKDNSGRTLIALAAA